MSASKPLTCRRIRSSKRWSIATMIAMIASMVSPALVPTVHAQIAPVGAGFTLNAGDLRFIFHAIEIAQDHAAGGTLLGPGPNQVQLGGRAEPQLPLGLRTVDGSFNNLVPGQQLFGASDRLFPRMTTSNFRPAEQGTSYAQLAGDVIDSQPRVISNLIVDQSAQNASAAAAAANPCGSGGFVCSPGTTLGDPGPGTAAFPAAADSGSLFIPNITPDFGLSAPFNLLFTFFGQFFDHGLDLVNKGGNGTVIMPLQLDDPLFRPGADTNFMAMPRASVDANHNGINQTTPFVDQNQTYTSHPSHQVFLRQYVMVTNSATLMPSPVQDGKMLDGSDPAFCSPRGTGILGDEICNIGNWGEVKAQAATKLGIRLTDADVFNVPLLLTDPYGHFKPGAHGFPQIVDPASPGGLLEGVLAANGGPVDIPATAARTNHQFLNDVAHSAVPTLNALGALFPDTDLVAGGSLDPTVPAGSYDNELLDMHFITGDGRGNENIALTAMHTLFHAEHNRLAADVDRLVNTPLFLTPAEVAAWHSVHAGSGWGYGERLFQAARFVTEMEYQHLVFEEFARKVQPLVHPFTVYQTSIDPAIKAEFAHTVYRLGHSMLPEVLGRINANGTTNDVRLLAAFLNPAAFNNGGTAGPLTAAQATGSLVRGLSQQIGNELDEFVTASVRNTLVGLPLDLAAINIARGRSEGIPPLNLVRRQLFTLTGNSVVAPYANWFEFGLNLKHPQTLANFVAAYGTHSTITAATTLAGKRLAAAALVNPPSSFMFQAAATSGLDKVDFWPGGMAERQTAFGGLLGTTFNFVFQLQLEILQDGDRFYYLQRTDGLNLRLQLESNSFSELMRRNTDFQGGMNVVFETADFNLDAGAFTGTAPVNLDADPVTGLCPVTGCIQLLTLADGTKFFFDPLHQGKNIVFNGTAGDDKMMGDIGDDTFYGNAGNDRIQGGDGNDTLVGGDGDDILFSGDGDDFLKGGPGNDAMNGGPGFGGDLMMGGDGNDFMVGGQGINEFFGGPGDDIAVDGDANTEGIVGGLGDDWLEGGNGHDANMFGDNGNFFDLLAGLSAVGGDDVLNGEAGQDSHFGEGGDDIFIMNEGTETFFGDFGYDWITMRGFPFAADIELDLLILPAAPVNFNDTRNKYRYVDGASGWDLNDHIRGDSRVNTPGAPPELAFLPGMELNAGTAPVGDVGGSGAAKIAGLTDLMVIGFGQTFPFNAGNILFGGLGSDLIEGKGGDDLIDGDRWLNVQLKATYNPGTVNPDGTVNGGTLNPDGTISNGTVKLVDFARSLIDDVFADPQRLNPGNIHIVRTIETPPVVPPADCGVAVPLNCDTAVFSGPFAQYTITNVPTAFGNRVTVTDNGTTGGIVGPGSNGTDTLLNIELLAFADGTRPAPGVVFNVSAPNVVGLTQAAAGTAITGAFLTVGGVTTASSTTIAAGSVISQSPLAGVSVAIGSAVALVVSSGPPMVNVPNVVGSTQAVATAAITGASLTVGVTTSANSPTVAIDSVISQSPVGGTSVGLGTAVDLVISLGPVLVAAPNVVGSTQAVATAAITGVGLTVGAITTSSSTTVAAGSVISQSPGGGTSVAIGSAVTLVVSSGPPVVAVPNVVGSTQAVATAAITGAGLTVGAVTTANSTTVAAGNVISQSPVGGTSVAIGSAVNVVVSLGTNAAPVLTATVLRNSQATALLRSPAITSVANSLLVAFVAADANPAGPNTTVTGVTNNGAVPLTWTRAVGTTAASQLGMAEIWWAYSTSAQTLINVSATLSSSKAASMTVMAFTGADPALIGAGRTIANALTGAPTASLVTTRGNSLVFGVGADFSNGRTMVAGAGQTKINQFVPTVNDTYWVQRVTAPVPTAGSTATISDTYAGAMTDMWNLAVIEIRHP